MTQPLSLPIVAAIALTSGVLAALAFRAFQRSGQRSLRFVIAGFSIFALKGVLAIVILLLHALDHDDLEVVLGLMDLTALVIIAFPFVRPRL